ncbi:helix-turn-helix domain-containing protein [Pseudomonas syringae]|uniref:helix-turn-helix domain-containing protein n=1 Tax=Pseudomonas syringae TaxID=317 RepID=UPI001F22299B|nr:helix-turn-helix transcriptional regulator [Pseudomonas syringae]MCF5226568.1 helix-turn-helix domain-containing protein [Pseudomonas syringae]MCF5241914.1 helix-turn-helix domain-containing protein [Pseudomonas syringae]
MHHPEGFPAKLARIRAYADMTQKDLSKASGISVPQIGRYETGLSKPRMNALIKLAKALNVSVSELQDSDGEPESVSFIMLEDGAKDAPAVMPRAMYDAIHELSAKCGISLNAAFVASVEVLNAHSEGREADFDSAINNALEFLGERRSLPSTRPDDGTERADDDPVRTSK